MRTSVSPRSVGLTPTVSAAYPSPELGYTQPGTGSAAIIPLPQSWSSAAFPISCSSSSVHAPSGSAAQLKWPCSQSNARFNFCSRRKVSMYWRVARALLASVVALLMRVSKRRHRTSVRGGNCEAVRQLSSIRPRTPPISGDGSSRRIKKPLRGRSRAIPLPRRSAHTWLL